MSYIVLARKYRPQQFEDLVGQLPVSQTLQNALESGRIAHAYVFSGPRGVGKTTTARLLAKCLNCVKGPTLKPCNTCPSCTAIAQGNSMQDVLEIDGASNRGIEQIRELRESAKYAPSSSRYRIYIIDEAHQITKDAFGALLKTLEEPPAHVVFMMATTEVQKIPAPILSRCQRFSLRPVAPELVLKHLKDICQKEKIKVEESALADIVRFVEGSLRDALSLLDQAIVFAPNGITSTTLKDLLGLLPREVIREAAGIIAAGDPSAILKHVSGSIQSGIDLTQLAKDLQEYYHTLLLIKAGVEDVFQTDLKALQKETESFDFPTLERNIRLLGRALEEMRRSETPRAVFEICALKLGQKTIDPKILIERLEKLEEGPKSGGFGLRSAARLPNSQIDMNRSSGGQASRPAASQEKISPNFGRPETSRPEVSGAATRETRHGEQALERSQMPPAAKDSSTVALKEPEVSTDIRSGWPNFVNAVAEQKVALASALEEAHVNILDRRIILSFKKQFSQQQVIRSMEILGPLLVSHFGHEVSLESRLDHTAPSHPLEEKPAHSSLAPPPPAALSDGPSYEEIPSAEVDDQIQKVLKYFPGTVKKEKK